MATTQDPSCQAAGGQACTNATEPVPKSEPTRGVLYRPATGVANGRFVPRAELSPFVEHYWWVRWDVTEPHVSEVLSFPSVHVVFEGLEARIVGVVKGRFVRRLEGQGAVCSIKFQPGMFRLLHPEPAVRLTDATIPLGRELGRAPEELARALLELPTEALRAQLLESRLGEVAPAITPDAELARDLVNRVRSDVEQKSVAMLASFAGLSERALQRLFREYVGVGPKWVVRRFRLQEAAERLRRGDESIAAVAASLGYFDQPHFVRDFKAVVGATPSAYVERLRGAS
jgi:AraC-like DNA-binding protein